MDSEKMKHAPWKVVKGSDCDGVEDERGNLIADLCAANDAILIAAAPELLAALQAFVSRAEDLSPLDTGPLYQARSAIAKATGQ